MMSDIVRCAVIGAGGIGQEHCERLLECPQAALVALAENNPERARQTAERFHIAGLYSDYRALLERPDIDAVTIALPNYLHAPAAIDALEAGKHVLLEKPMATSYAEALRIAETVRRTRRTLMVGQNMRFTSCVRIARQEIARGTLGRIYHARGFWLRPWGIPRIGSWFTQKNLAGGGCLCDLGVHLLDLCLFLLGDFRVRRVSGRTFGMFGRRGLAETDWGRSEIDPGRPCDVEDYGLALLHHESGASILLEICWAAHLEQRKREIGVDLRGTEAGLSLFPAQLHRWTDEGSEHLELRDDPSASSQNRIQHFIECLLEGRPPLVRIEESLAVQRILDAIYLSSESGLEIVLEDYPAAGIL